MYHYTECGLDNVWLEDGYRDKETPYGKAVAVSNATELLGLIAAKLAKKEGRLTGKEFRFLRVQLSMSQSVLAKIQGVTEQSLSLWERTGKVPRANDQLLRVLYLRSENNDRELKDLIDRMNTVERLVHQKIIVRSSAKGWISRAEEDERYTLAA